MKKAITALVGTGIFLVSSSVFAQQQGGYGWSGSYSPTAPPPRSSDVDNLGEEMQFVFGVDRTMGLAFDRVKISDDAGDVVNKSTTFNLFGVPGGANNAGAPSLLFPRLALDFFVVEGVSIGGSLIFATSSAKVDDEDSSSTTTFGIMPRVGYAYAFDETFSIWPRLGITYLSSKTTDKSGTSDVETSWNGVELTGELMLGISPIENFAFLVGPYVDFPLSGTAKAPNPVSGDEEEFDAKLTSFGLAVSILGYY